MKTHVVIPVVAQRRAGTQSGMTTERDAAPDASGSRVFGSAPRRTPSARDDNCGNNTLTASTPDGNAHSRVASHWTYS